MKMGKRKLQAIETKKRIYEASRELIHKYGYDNVTIDAIVEAAAVSKGSFYVHFESKDALAAQLVNDYTKLADIRYKSFLSTLSEQNSIFEILILLAEEIADVLASNIGYDSMRVLYKAHLSKTVAANPAISYSRGLYQLISEILNKGVHQGELREDISVDNLARHLILAIRGITFEWCIRYPDFDLKEQIMEHFNILLFGLKK